MRNDIVQALRAIQIPNLRWPGGCFADEYHWMDGIGPKQARPSMVNTHWGGVTENNHFGTHEFMDLCAQLGCEPYICGNVGSGTVQEMQQWVEYITFGGQSPMADLRRKHGREQPWQLKYWGVGNENWGCGGSMRAEQYADEYRRYQTYVRSFGDNQIYKIACGPRNEDYHWTEVLMQQCRNLRGRFLMHGLSLHYYTPDSPWRDRLSATQFGEWEWAMILQTALRMDELITRHSAIMDQYDPEKQVGLIVDEWGAWYQVEPGTNPRFLYQQNSLRDALLAALTLDIFNKHCGRVHMANIAQTVNVLQAMILTQEEKLLLTPSYHVFEMYQVHHDATRLPIDVTSETYRFEEFAMPAISASASRAAAGTVHLTVSNLDPGETHEVVCDLRPGGRSEVQGRVLTADAITAHNTFDAPDRVQPAMFTGANLRNDKLTLTLPPKSVTVLEFV
jgi:alpha-N-arabinofuranosidase